MSRSLEEALHHAIRRGSSAETPGRFIPPQPRSFEEAGVERGLLESLALKLLLIHTGVTGAKVARRLALHGDPVRQLLGELKREKMVVHRGSTPMGDFRWELSEVGRQKALDLSRHSLYADAAPVTLEAYASSVAAQSVRHERLKPADLGRAFADLVVDPTLLRRLGPAVASARGLFLHGRPGNGKTSLARRVVRAFSLGVYVPRAVLVGGFIVKVFDPAVHRPLEAPARIAGQRVDPRWVYCQRPAVVAGGELSLESLEMAWNPSAGVCEAPLQVKANCGILVLDDFGRQRVEPAALLNRWIVPMEERVDYLSMPDGRKAVFPFDPFLVFATNLDPASLVDEAFLRRIPYKIDVPDPSEAAFRELLRRQCEALELTVVPGVVDYLIQKWYRGPGRPLRACHPRDLLLQVRDYCAFAGARPEVSRETINQACENYFLR